MTPTEQAARWLADVPRHSGYDIMWQQDGHPGRPTPDGKWIPYDAVIAAIARLFAPGDDLVERASFIGEPCPYREGSNSYVEFHASQRRFAADALARISALTATVAEAREQRSDAEARMETAEAENATLSARLARMEGALRAPWLEDHLTPWQIAALTDGGSNG